MKTLKAALLATIFATSATIAYAQVSVDAGASTTVDGTVSAGAGDSSTSVGTGVDANAAVSAGADANAEGGSYSDLSASLSSTVDVDLPTVTDATEIDVVLISSLSSEAEASGWAELKSQSSAKIEALHDSIEKNSALNTRLTAELSAAGDFTLDDVVSVSTAADGSLTVYVDDSE